MHYIALNAKSSKQIHLITIMNIYVEDLTRKLFIAGKQSKDNADVIFNNVYNEIKSGKWTNLNGDVTVKLTDSTKKNVVIAEKQITF